MENDEEPEYIRATVFRNNKSYQITITKDIIKLYGIEVGDMIKLRFEKILLKAKEKKK